MSAPISVSDTNRPPNAPKYPWASGRVAGICVPHGLNEGPDFLPVLAARHGFDAARHIDGKWAQQPHRLRSILRRQSAGDDDSLRQSTHLLPAKRLPAAGAGVEQGGKHAKGSHLLTEVAGHGKALDRT